MTTQLLQEATAFLWTEGDMLDRREYSAWLDLWSEDGLYVVPVDPLETDFFNSLNYANDDADMRRLRVERLTGGESISVSPAPRTVRQISRVRIVGEEAGVVTVRSAQLLSEFRKNGVRSSAADVEYRLLRAGPGFKLQRKVVRLVNADDPQMIVGFIY
jgi:3-phenylpropionate/cinnamic acid dioxygenase small subunit